MAKKSQAATQRVHCNHCHNTTDHLIVKTTINSGETEAEDYWQTTFDMLECCGCREVVLRRRFEFPADHDPEPDVRYFPPPVSRDPPRWRHRLPNDMRTVFDEIYRSLDANTRCLPMMGARTLLDMLMVQKVGDVGGFKQKLKKLESDGLISAQHVDVLDAALDAGSAAAHRGHAPEEFQVNTVMDILENLLQAFYVLPGMARILKQSTPQRPCKKKQH
jgi:hypothetical protein